MSPSSSKKRNWQLPLTTLLVVLGLAVAALGVVLLRQRISLAAGRVQHLEWRLRAIDRAKRDLDAKIAETHEPQFLKDQVRHHLQLPAEDQVVWVLDSSPRAVAAIRESQAPVSMPTAALQVSQRD